MHNNDDGNNNGHISIQVYIIHEAGTVYMYIFI